MPIGTTLPKHKFTIRFPAHAEPGTQEESYQLLELPAEILKKVESSSEPFPSVWPIPHSHDPFR